MKYRILQTPEAEDDIFQLADYMVNTLKNHKAANDFLNRYYQMVDSLETFPFGYRGISFEYRGYEIRLKPYDSYNIFFIVDTNIRTVTILRVLKDRQDWKSLLLRNE